ncbi:MAG: YHYH protein [Planctomycetaceae bacterium]
MKSLLRLSLYSMLAMALLGPQPAMAHPGHSHRTTDAKSQERTWIAASGAFRERGSFVIARDGQVQIRRADESLVTLPIELLQPEDQQWIERRTAEIRVIAEMRNLLNSDSKATRLVDGPTPDLLQFQELLLAQRDPVKKGAEVGKGNAPEMAKSFEAFVKLKAIKTRWDDRYFYVESNGMPDHQMMVGITSWQQQVPLPQKYTGDNAWQIPLHPVPAKTPASTKDRFLRGAIAVAANGIPIFNPLNNRGDDAYLFGELDEFGGHCGRADDYHYHIAPVHLEKTIGKGLPIAYALDGYPIYGYEEPDGSKVKNLDALNGHKDEKGNYHYHATKTYPYLNGGFYGEVIERGGQVDPQPRAEPVRPDLRPLQGAKITDFKQTKPKNYLLTYDVRGKKGTVAYVLNDDGSARFTFTDTDGKSTSESYTPRRRGPGGGDDRPPPPRPGEGRPPRPGENRPPRPEDDRPPRDGQRPPPRNEPSSGGEAAAISDSKLPKLVVTSSAIKADGVLPVEFTCDGESSSPPIEWTGAPKETRFYALNLWHVAPGNDIKSYWLLYNIPASSSKIPKNVKDVGQIGLNDKNRREYDPMCSKGPGVKKYHVTVYALSSELRLSPDRANRAALLAAIKDVAIAEGTLTFQYERKK